MKKVLLLLLLTGLVSVSQAAWTLLDNFNGYSEGQTTVVTNGVWHAEFSDPVPNPGDHTGNSAIVASDMGNSLWTKGGTAWRGSERDISGTNAAVVVDEIQTYFWQVQCYSTGGGYDFMMGLSPSIDNIDIWDAWQDFSVMPYINNGATTPFINADAPTSPWWAPMSTDTWTNVWIVVDNDSVDPTFDLYYSTGTNAASLVIADANWRNFAGNVDLNAIGFMAAGGAGSEYLIDNIYYADGVDLSNPVPEPATMALLGLGALITLRKRK